MTEGDDDDILSRRAGTIADAEQEYTTRDPWSFEIPNLVNEPLHKSLDEVNEMTDLQSALEEAKGQVFVNFMKFAALAGMKSYIKEKVVKDDTHCEMARGSRDREERERWRSTHVREKREPSMNLNK